MSTAVKNGESSSDGTAEVTTRKRDGENGDEASQNIGGMRNGRSDLPEKNILYAEKEYWESRFAIERECEWLVPYAQIRDQLAPFLTTKDVSTGRCPEDELVAPVECLVVGCGNSPFSADLYDDDFRHITNIDFSEEVIDAMRRRNEEKRPCMKWKVMDMTDMTDIADESFDVVIDKAAMDALLSREGDVWNPYQHVIDQARAHCRHISRVLRPGGHYLQISFAQPHFRKVYLLGWHPKREGEERTRGEVDCFSEEFGWSFRFETINTTISSFEHFLYIMTKTCGGKANAKQDTNGDERHLSAQKL